MGMNGWTVIRDFIEVLEQKGRRQSLYRGQPNVNWKLVPSIYRPKARGIHNPDILNDWKSRASRFASPMPINDTEWLVLAQHYGLATNLLDWTTSPLVALFFACDGDDQKKSDGCVWRTMRGGFEEAHHTLSIDLFRGDRPKPFLINAIGRNARSTAQDSFLSLHTTKDYQNLKAEKIFEVSGRAKRDTILTLEKLGLTAERLHFDITRLVERFK